MPLKYKKTEDGHIVVNDKGHPIAVDENTGKEFGIDAISNFGAIPQLREEAKRHREAFEAVESKLKIIRDSGIEEDKLDEWVSNAVKAIDQVKNFNDGDWVKANELENIKATATKELEGKLKDLNQKYTNEIQKLSDEKNVLSKKIEYMLIDDQFGKSKFLKDNVNHPIPVIVKNFREHFEVEIGPDGKEFVVARDSSGEKILDPGNNFEVAGFDEAMAVLIDKSGMKDYWLSRTPSGGPGGTPNDKIGSGSDYSNNPFKRGKTWNLTEQGRLVRENPDMAKRLAHAAGVKLNF